MNNFSIFRTLWQLENHILVLHLIYYIISAAFGPAIPTQAPVVDLSQYPDNIAEMKKLLVEKDAKIKALEARLQTLNKETKTDSTDRLDLVTMLDGVNEPTMDKYGGKFLKTAIIEEAF